MRFLGQVVVVLLERARAVCRPFTSTRPIKTKASVIMKSCSDRQGMAAVHGGGIQQYALCKAQKLVSRRRIEKHEYNHRDYERLRLTSGVQQVAAITRGCAPEEEWAPSII